MEHNNHHFCCSGRHEDHGCCCQKNMDINIELSDDEKSFLSVLAKTPFLPIVSFVAKSSKSDHLENIMLSPVYIENSEDALFAVKNRAEILNSLEEKGAISIDYDLKIENADYDFYKNSEVYKYFVEIINESKANPDFIFDIPYMECGSIALTGIGQEIIDED